MAVVDACTLPRQRPSAGLARDVVRAVACDKQPPARRNRQDAFVLQQNQRFSHRLACDRAMFRRPEQFVLAGQQAIRWLACVKQAQPAFDPQDLGHGIVDPGHRDAAGPGARQKVLVHRFPGVGRHIHVDPGHQGLRAAFIGAAGNLAVGIPVGDDEPAEIHPVFQHAGDQRSVAGHLLALPAGKADHDGRHTFGDGRAIRFAVNVAQIFFADGAVALIDAIVGPAIGEEMLGRGKHKRAGEQIVVAGRALQAAHHRADIGSDQIGIGRISFVGAAPAEILGDGHRRGECPFLAGHADFPGRDRADFLDQSDIAHRAKTDIVRKQGRADDIGMTVDGIRAPDQRDAYTAIRCIDGGKVELVCRCQPVGRRRQVVAVGATVPADQNGTEIVVLHILRRDAAQIGLHQLTDLFFDRHCGKQTGNARLVIRLERHGIFVCGPDFRIGDTLFRTLCRAERYGGLCGYCFGRRRCCQSGLLRHGAPCEQGSCKRNRHPSAQTGHVLDPPHPLYVSAIIALGNGRQSVNRIGFLIAATTTGYRNA